jgi:hypothetical protein
MGGGVGVYPGISGVGGVNQASGYYSGGQGGSGGTMVAISTTTGSETTTLYGAGGGGLDDTGGSAPNGTQGVIRIIWPGSRTFPTLAGK